MQIKLFTDLQTLGIYSALITLYVGKISISTFISMDNLINFLQVVIKNSGLVTM